MDNRYDLVIVGGGNGGNMAACRASAMGLKTLVIEKHNMVGGAATSFVRGRFEFEASLHEIPDFGQGAQRGNLGRLFDELGIQMDWLLIPDAFRTIVAEGDKITLDVTVPHGREAFMACMESQSPGCSKSLELYFEGARELERGLNYLGASRGKPDPEVLRRDYPLFCKIMSMSTAEYMRAVKMPQKIQDIIGAYWPYQGSDLETIDASRYLLMTEGYFLAGAYMPKLRSHEIANAIQKRAREMGCDFWYETEVTKILTKKGAVCGVETKDGRRVEACAVIANVFPDIVYGKLLDNKSLVPAFERKKIQARSYGFRGFSVYMGLDRTAEELGIKDYNVFINSSADTRVLYQQAAAPELPLGGRADNLSCTCLNIVNPEATPPGTAHFAITSGYAADAWDKAVTPENYVRVKREIADKMIERYEEVMGIDIRNHIEEIAIATPVTFARYMGTPQGVIYGYHSSRWDGMSARTMVGGSEPTVPGLFFVGAHGNRLSGFLPTLTSGDITAKQVMGYVMGGGNA